MQKTKFVFLSFFFFIKKAKNKIRFPEFFFIKKKNAKNKIRFPEFFMQKTKFVFRSFFY